MDLNKALDFFKKKYPDKKAVGYWKDGENIVFNVKPQYGSGFSEVCQYVVRSDGTIYGTNPSQCLAIVRSPMIKV